MAVPLHQVSTLLPSELRFIAENEKVTVIPQSLMKKMQLVDGSVPLLRANRRVELPLWIALILKLRQKCRMVPPSWLSLELLKSVCEEEKALPQFSTRLPPNWLEISKIYLTRASDDLQDLVTLLHQILQDIRDIRLLKVNQGLEQLNESNFTLTGLSLMEVNEMRPFVLRVMDQLRKLSSTRDEGGLEPEEPVDDDDMDDY